MACTEICILSFVLNLGLVALCGWLSWNWYSQRRKNKTLVAELGSDSLEHYLQEIKKRGFDFTLRPKKK